MNGTSAHVAGDKDPDRYLLACDGIRKPYIPLADKDETSNGRAIVEDTNQPERPRVEPEIIPPDRTQRQSERRQHTGHVSTAADGIQRICVARLGPFGIALLMLIIGVLAAVILLAVVGVVLIWIPVVVLLVAAGAIFRLLRR